MQAASCSYAVPAQLRARTLTRLGLAASPALPNTAVRRCTPLRPRAEGQSNNSSTPPGDGDARVEALEAAVRARKGTKAQQVEARRPGGGARGSSSSSGTSQFAEWKEGSLLPEGWDQMDPLEKVRQWHCAGTLARGRGKVARPGCRNTRCWHPELAISIEPSPWHRFQTYTWDSAGSFSGPTNWRWLQSLAWRGCGCSSASLAPRWVSISLPMT